MSSGRRILIIAGPNGAGKTTFATEYVSRWTDFPDFVNADLIARGHSPLGRLPDHLAAGRYMVREMEARIRRGASFAFETTLAGRAPLRWIPRWQAAGYRIQLLYLKLTSPERAVQRVRQRVAEGGHDVSESVIRRRFVRSWRNFEELYRPIVDCWAVYENSGPEPVLLAEGCRRREDLP